MNINSIIEVKCKHCGNSTKIDVKSITTLQDRVRELEKQIADIKGSGDLSGLMNMFGMK